MASASIWKHSSISLHSPYTHPLSWPLGRVLLTSTRLSFERASSHTSERSSISQRAQWASARTLKELVIRTCFGVHYGALVLHVANGVFGQLKNLSVIRSGYEDLGLSEAVSQPPTWTINVLERLVIDHADHQEIKALSIIHAQEVYATRVFTSAIIEALNAGGWPGMRTLHTLPQGDGSGPQFLSLKQACDAREISLSTDARPYSNCNCHNQ